MAYFYRDQEISDEEEKKKIDFVARFRKLVGKKTKAKAIAEKLEKASGIKVPEQTIYKWLQVSNPTMPTIKNCELICEAYGCDMNYLLSGSEDFNIDYKKISEITGLSSRAIRVLESINNNAPISDDKGIIVDTSESSGRHQTTIDLINYILEKNYDDRGEYTLFDYIYRAIFLPDFVSSIDDMSGFIHPETLEEIKASKYDLFQTYNLNQVTKWIMDRYQERKEDKR